MSEKFQLKKQRILNGLSKPNDDYTDASPKGSVDDGVRDLIDSINSKPGFVTTSSCAGRIAVYLEGPPGPPKSISYPGDDDEAAPILRANNAGTSAGGKGGGKWLFSSHTPVDVNNIASAGIVYELFGFSSEAEISYPSADTIPQFIHFKFEPMILHILTASAEDAHAVLQAATQSGFRESGISGLLDNKGLSSTPMVAVRTSGLALDSIIGFKDSNTGSAVPMVSEAYLRAIVKLANERFSMNEERKGRFSDAFSKQTLAPTSGSKAGDDESRAARRAKKRAEGQARQQQMLLSNGASNGSPQDTDELDGEGEGDHSLALLLGSKEDTKGNLNNVDHE